MTEDVERVGEGIGLKEDGIVVDHVESGIHRSRNRPSA
jgi:hypothetical protein